MPVASKPQVPYFGETSEAASLPSAARVWDSSHDASQRASAQACSAWTKTAFALSASATRAVTESRIFRVLIMAIHHTRRIKRPGATRHATALCLFTQGGVRVLVHRQPTDAFITEIHNKNS